MSDITLLTILNYDNRVEARAMEIMRIKADFTKFKAFLIILMLILTIHLIIIPLPTFISVILAIRNIHYIILSIISIDKIAAFMSRVSFYKFLKTLVVRYFSTIAKKGIIIDEDIHDAVITECDQCIANNKKQWDQLDKLLDKPDTYEIAQYWQELGLNNKKVKEMTKCIYFDAKEPVHKNEQTDYCIDMREKINEDSKLTKYGQTWVRSDMSDRMHVVSLYRRLCSKKRVLNMDQMDKLVEIIDYMQTQLPECTVEYNQAVLNALGTSGSAGQFSKRSDFEEIWKNKQSEEGVKTWLALIKKLLKYVYITNELPYELVQFILYRKMEAIDSVQGKPKATRLMNAPNLVCRLMDCVAFSSFNDAMIQARYSLPTSLGMNIFLELKMIHFRNKDYIYIAADFSDYDCSQHPVQAYAVAKARIKYMIRNKDDIKNICYILPKYKNHMVRNVKSTWGITYNVIGQQASGDITTSDDNTSKTTAVALQFIEYMKQYKMVAGEKGYVATIDDINFRQKNIDVTGDDVGIAVIPTENFDKQKVEQMYHQATNDLGWTVKEGSFSIKQMGDEPLDYLSHGVEDREFITVNNQMKLKFRCLVRPTDRQWGKFFISPEITNVLSLTNKAKLMSKYMTLCMASISNAPLMIASLYMMLKLRSSPSEITLSYSWAGIKASTLGCLSLNHCLELQLGFKIKCDFAHIVVPEKHIDDFIMMTSELHSLFKGIMNKEKRVRKDIDFESLVTVTNENQWNYNDTLWKIKQVFSSFDKHGLLAMHEDKQKWWEIANTPVKTYQEIKNHNEKWVTFKAKCKHCKPEDVEPLVNENDNHPYPLYIMCYDCYKNRKEMIYAYIYFAIENNKINKTDPNYVEIHN